MIAEFLRKIFPSDAAHIQSWQPQRHTFLQDPKMTDTLHNEGFCVAGTLESDQVEKLKELYAALHNFQSPEGGMFYSVYSRDLDYRKKVHQGIEQILKPVYDSLFTDYKSILNSYIVKVSGPGSEFSLHQDSTGLDETKYSCLSVWIPLQDTDTDNGCMFVMPRSHKMFSPYRGISFPQPFDNIQPIIRKYLKPVELKRGDILLFDNRIVHTSVANLSDQDRIVVMSGIFPQEAPFISCYKDMSDPANPIELIEQPEDYLLTFENFFHDCTCRPETGRSVGFVRWNTDQMSEKQFLSLCEKYDVREINHSSVIHSSAQMNIIGEPV
jgi:hypothetical protein